MPSPLCTVKDGASGAAQSGTAVCTVTPGNTVTIALADATGVSTWALTCLYTDETTTPAAINALLSVNGTTKTATFTPPATGQAYIFQSTINGGLNANGQADASLVTTFKVATLSTFGTFVVASNETVEHGSSGWLPVLNDACRGKPQTYSSDFSGSFYKSSPDGAVTIYRRGDTISSPLFQARWVGTIPTSVNVMTLSNDIATSPTAPTPATPFESFQFTGSLAGSTANAVYDPYYTVTLTADYNPGKANVDPTATVTRTLTRTIYFTSDVYFGASSLATITEANVYTGGVLQSGFSDRLQRTRTGTFSITASATGYLYLLWPSHAQYTTGTTSITVTTAGYTSTTFSAANTVAIIRGTSSVTRTYQVFRSASTVPAGTYTVVVS